MEETVEKSISKRNGLISKKIISDNITVLDLSCKNIQEIDNLPVNLTDLSLAHNNLKRVPAAVQYLTKIRILDLSFNNIEYFDETPKFSQTLEHLNISNNKLLTPPHWVWAGKLSNLKEINFSCNEKITSLLLDDFYKELLLYKTSITNVIMFNCDMNKTLKLFQTFPKAKLLCLGTSELSNTRYANYIEEVPCIGLDRCYDLESINLVNTGINKVNPNILMYKNLKEIDLSLNAISYIPPEFCSLENLEVCILSFNNLLYLPNNFTNLCKLHCLRLNNNNLCVLPEKICQIPFLKTLDLYANNLNDLPEGINCLEEVDLAQNYFEEPLDEEYVKKKKKIRIKSPERCDGRKIQVAKTESEHSKTSEQLSCYSNSEVQDMPNFSDTSEDWDSDEYWIPHFTNQSSSQQSPWLCYVKKKMQEGNFCPMDAHQVPVADQVRYEKLCNPQVMYESDGQFDDYSSDDS